MEECKICLRIDHREGVVKTTLSSLLDEQHVEYVCENLDCGDFVVEINDQAYFVIERKTIKDLISSIKDGRYKEQKRKMIEKFGRDKLFYLIEGDLSFVDCPYYLTDVEYKSVKTSVINTQLRDRIQVLHTKDINESCALICEILKRVINDPNKYLTQCVYDTVKNTPSSSVRKKHSKTDVFIQQLCQISGISGKTADALSKEFVDMKTFYSTLSPLDDEQKLKLLKNIYLKDNRRINGKVAEQILQYMF